MLLNTISVHIDQVLEEIMHDSNSELSEVIGYEVDFDHDIIDTNDKHLFNVVVVEQSKKLSHFIKKIIILMF